MVKSRAPKFGRGVVVAKPSPGEIAVRFDDASERVLVEARS